MPSKPRLALQTYHSANLRALAISPDGMLLATAGEDWTVRTWQRTSGWAMLVLKEHLSEVAALAFAPLGSLLASADSSGRVIVWDLNRGEAAVRLEEPDHYSPYAMAFSPDGSHLALAAGMSTAFPARVQVWNLSLRTIAATLQEASEGIASIAFTPDGRGLWTAGADGQIKRWNVERGVVEESWEAHPDPIVSMSLASRGGRVATADTSGLVRVWDTSDHAITCSLSSGSPQTTHVALDVDGALLAVASDGLKLYDAATAAVRLVVADTMLAFRTLQFTAKGDGIAGIAWGPETNLSGDIVLWETSTGTVQSRPKGHATQGLIALANLPKNRSLASASSDGIVTLWDCAVGTKIRTRDMLCPLSSLTSHPNGQVLVACGGQQGKGRVLILDPVDLRVLRELTGHLHLVREAAFSADGRVLVTAADDGKAIAWRTETWEQQISIDLQSPLGLSCCLTQDGHQAFVGLRDGTIRVLDVQTGAVIRNMRNQTNGVYALALSPDGRLLASGGVNSDVVTLWDATTGDMVDSIHEGLLAPRALRFAAGNRLLAANVNGYVVSLDLTAKRLLAVLCVHDLPAVALAPNGVGGRWWSAGHDHVLNLVHTDSRGPLASLCDSDAVLGSGTPAPDLADSLVLLPNGFFAGSNGAARRLRIWRSSHLTAAYALRAEFRRPKAVAAALKGP